jgi:hypothetical protein
MGAPRWTEQPKEAGPLEPLRTPIILNDGRRASRGLPWDPGGGWTTDDNHRATSWAVNIAIPGVRVLWGSPHDLGPATVGGERNKSPRDGSRIPGQYFEGERIVIPIPDSGGEFDIQTWGAFAGSESGQAGDTSAIWEWGRVDSREHRHPARRRFTFPPLTAQPPPPPPPATKTSTQVRNEAVAMFKAWETTQSGPIETSRIRIAREILELKDTDWNGVKQSFRVELDQLREEE